jgi:hypothetical protein
MDLAKFRFSLLQAYSLSRDCLKDKLINSSKSKRARGYALVTLDKNNIEYKEVYFLGETYFPDSDDLNLNFTEIKYSTDGETRFFTENLLSNYGESWLILDQKIVRNLPVDLYNLIYPEGNRYSIKPLNDKKQNIRDSSRLQ